MSRKARLTQAEAKALLNESPSEATKARQLARSEADRWIALSELQVEVNRMKIALLALEKRVEENERSYRDIQEIFTSLRSADASTG